MRLSCFSPPISHLCILVLMLFELGYRYWIHILLSDEALNQEHPYFSSWKDTRSKDSMFTSEQVKEWDWKHLLGCHWYIEMPFLRTLPHEVNNRQTVDTDFQMPLLTGPNITHVEEQTKGRIGKQKVKSAIQSTKRGLPVEGPEASKKSKTIVDKDAQHDPEEITFTQSEAKSSRAVSQTTLSHGGRMTGVVVLQLFHAIQVAKNSLSSFSTLLWSLF